MDAIDIQRARLWYALGNTLSTIAQHYGLTVEELKNHIRTEGV